MEIGREVPRLVLDLMYPMFRLISAPMTLIEGCQLDYETIISPTSSQGHSSRGTLSIYAIKGLMVLLLISLPHLVKGTYYVLYDLFT